MSIMNNKIKTHSLAFLTILLWDRRFHSHAVSGACYFVLGAFILRAVRFGLIIRKDAIISESRSARKDLLWFFSYPVLGFSTFHVFNIGLSTLTSTTEYRDHIISDLTAIGLYTAGSTGSAGSLSHVLLAV